MKNKTSCVYVSTKILGDMAIAIRDKFTAKMYKGGKERKKTSLFSDGTITYVENLNKLPYN